MSRIYADNIDPRNSGDLTVAGIATYNSTGADITGIVTATSFYGDVRPNSLEVSGVTTVSAGSASAPSITPTGDSNTGIFFPSADTIAFGEGGSEALRITSSGNVGIATNNPDALLHLDSTVGAGTSNYLLRLQNRTTTPDSRVGMALLTNFSGGSSAGYGAAIYASNDGASGKAHTIFGTLSSFAFDEHMRIDSSGRLLVGTTTSPSAGQGANSRLVVQGYVGDATDIGIMSIQRGEAAASISSGEAIGRIAFNDNAGNSFAYVEAFADADAGSDDFPGRLVFSTTADGASSPTERMRITSDAEVLIGTEDPIQPTTSTQNGVEINADAKRIKGSRDGGAPLTLQRTSSDGDLVEFYQDTSLEGSISVSGSTVSLNGAHLSRWSQLPGGAERTEILRGTVLSNIDEMCEWGDEDNEQLNRMKVSDVEGDKNVSGVFQAWDDDDDIYTNDFHCAMTGDFVIRIAQGVTVERGDLLMSAGDGTAKAQDDDIIRSKTIAKVTSTHVSETYADGSYCVPCVLMAC